MRENGDEPLRVLEENIAPFVCGKTAGEANSQNLWVQDLCRFLDLLVRGAASFQLTPKPSSAEVDETFPSPLVGPPQFRVWNSLSLCPCFCAV